jgi:broad specificity phosphatase PhoE
MKASSPKSLLLIRHAEVEERYQHVFGGRVDMDISPRGHEQAVALAQYLKRRKVDALFASPMKRVQQTLSAYANNGAPKAVILPDLREVDFGDWTGHGWVEVHAKFGISAYSWIDQLDCGGIANAENIVAYRERISGVLATIRQCPPSTTTAVFCHGGVIRMMLALLLDIPFPRTNGFAIDYASVTEVALKTDRNEIQLLNFTPWRELSS